LSRQVSAPAAAFDMKSENPKQKLLSKLAECHEIATIRGSDVVALNSKAILYLRYNKNAGPSDKYRGRFWFGITKSEYDKYRQSNLFIICACLVSPSDVDYVVLPSEDFELIKKNIPLQSGQWKFNLLKTPDNKYTLQVVKGGMYDVTQYLNFFDFSPKEYRRVFSPTLTELNAPKADTTVEVRPPELSDLENELLISARDSANPKRFEVALERFFNEIGFRCKRIGGSGETDVLVYEPFRFIVDGKSTKTDSKSAINFTRIKRHKAQNDADFMVIASVGFDKAVGKDAELEGACLIEIQALAQLLDIHRAFVLSPFDYIEVFKQTGVVDSNKILEFRTKYEARGTTIAKALTIIENLDFQGRTIDEIKGRLDLYCEQKNIRLKSKEEIIKYLSFFSSETLEIINCVDGKYSLRFTPVIARNRLKSVLYKISEK